MQIMAAPRMGITYFDEGLPLSMSVVQYVAPLVLGSLGETP